MTFLEINRNFRSGKIENYKLTSGEEIFSAHQNNADLKAWLSCARIGSRFSLTTSTQRLLYIRTDTIDEEMIKKLEL